jgi:hypothetical protein
MQISKNPRCQSDRFRIRMTGILDIGGSHGHYGDTNI